MRREGRQHGLVTTQILLPPHLNPRRPKSRVLNRLDAPPTAGVLAKVSSKPTNHSKFTGRCRKPKCTSCHLRPACKAKDKAKGSHKLRSSDLVMMGAEKDGLGFDKSTMSATVALRYFFASDHDHSDGDDEDAELLCEPEGGLPEGSRASYDYLMCPDLVGLVLEDQVLEDDGSDDDDDGDWFFVGESHKE